MREPIVYTKWNFVEKIHKRGGGAGGPSDFKKPYFFLKRWKGLCLLFLLAGSNELRKCGPFGRSEVFFLAAMAQSDRLGLDKTKKAEMA